MRRPEWWPWHFHEEFLRAPRWRQAEQVLWRLAAFAALAWVLASRK